MTLLQFDISEHFWTLSSAIFSNLEDNDLIFYCILWWGQTRNIRARVMNCTNPRQLETVLTQQTNKPYLLRFSASYFSLFQVNCKNQEDGFWLELSLHVRWFEWWAYSCKHRKRHNGPNLIQFNVWILPKMIHSIFDSILLYPRFNSKYYSIQRKFWFISKNNSIQ